MNRVLQMGRQIFFLVDLPIGPQGVGGDTGDPIASDLTFGDNTTRKNTVLTTNADVDGHDMDEIAVVRQGIAGRQRLEIYNPPSTLNGQTGPPITSDLTFGGAGNNRNTVAISGMKL